jgi:hypothetical protein
LKDTSLTGNSTPILKRKHKHHRHHHICQHHQNRRNRVKNANQQPTIVYRKAINNEGHIIGTNVLAKVRYEIDNKTALIDDQQRPLVVYRDTNAQQSMITDGVSLDEDQTIVSY